jgi:hypothetical protein
LINELMIKVFVRNLSLYVWIFYPFFLLTSHMHVLSSFVLIDVLSL